MKNYPMVPLIAMLLFATDVLAQESTPLPVGNRQLFRIDPRSPHGLQEIFQPTGKPFPFVSAHRGGAQKGFPENCIATFEHTLDHSYAILEIDPRYTQDGEIVIHHDPTLERTTTGKGTVKDFTLEQLKQLRLKDTEGNVTSFPIPTLNEVIDWARGKTVLVLDQKDVPAMERVKAITQLKAEAYVMLIVMNFKDAQACHTFNPNVMMEVMIPTLEKAKQFDQMGVPWRNVVAFVGHTPPEDRELYAYIHGQGASCMIGTSRNLDRRILSGEVSDIKELEREYRQFLDRGADVIETDIPKLLGKLLNHPTSASSKSGFFHPK